MKSRLIIILLSFIVVVPITVFSKPLRIGFEGMPGAGKTSSLASLIEYLPNYCIFLPEVNLQNNFIGNKDKSEDIYHELWKTRAEIINSVGSN